MVSGATAGLLEVMSKPVLSELHTGITAALTEVHGRYREPVRF
jgi:hypothetical protein